MVKPGWKVDGRWMKQLNWLSNLPHIESCEWICLIYAIIQIVYLPINMKYMPIYKFKTISLHNKLTLIKTISILFYIYDFKYFDTVPFHNFNKICVMVIKEFIAYYISIKLIKNLKRFKY